MKKVKYKITDTFGNRNIGEIIDAFIIANDSGSDDRVLLYHPAGDKYECASLEMCRRMYNKTLGDYYVTAKLTWINLTKKAEQFVVGELKNKSKIEEDDKRVKKIKSLLNRAMKV